MKVRNIFKHINMLVQHTQSKNIFVLILFLFFSYCCSSTIVSIFPPLLYPTPPTPPPTLNPTPLCLCPWVLYTCSLMTYPFFPPYLPLPSPLVTVSLFFISVSLIIFCLLVCFIDQGQIIWYLSFTAWLISLR